MTKEQILKIINSTLDTLEDAFLNSPHEDIVEERVHEAIMDLQYLQKQLGKDDGQV